MRLPTLGVMIGTDPPPVLRALLVAAADRCFPVTCSVVEPLPTPVPVAYLWCGGSARPPAGAPYAAWAGHPGDLEHPVVRGAVAQLTDTPHVVELAGDRGVFVPAIVVAPQARPVSPFVRRRLRRARGLADVALARSEDENWYWADS